MWRAAEAPPRDIERAIHGLTTGLVEIPAGVDPGDFIVSGGTLRVAARPRRRCRSLAPLFEEYLANQAHKGPASVSNERIDLRNLARKLGSPAALDSQEKASQRTRPRPWVWEVVGTGPDGSVIAPPTGSSPG